jgi:uncharacterized membrane protein HdeD (DUF308 family)
MAQRQGRGLILASGILAVVAGSVAIVVPAVGSVGMAVFIGWLLVGMGAFMAVDAFALPGFARTAFRMLLAGVTLIAGINLLVAPLEGTYTLTVMLVIWFVAIGFVRVVVGIAEHGQAGAGMTAANGAVSLILGILIARRLPEAADWAIGLIVGIDLLMYGLTALFTWHVLGEAGAGTPDEPPAAPASA